LITENSIFNKTIIIALKGTLNRVFFI